MSENNPQSGSADSVCEQTPTLPPDVLRAVQEAFFRSNHGAVANRLWDRILTDEQREQLGGDFNAAYKNGRGAVGMWMSLYHVSQPRAAIELARRMDLLSESDFIWLDREIAKVDPTPPDAHRLALARDLEASIASAKNSHALVLVEGNGYHRLYWRGDWIRGDWGGNPLIWELLWSLADKARLGQRTGWDILTGKNSRAVVNRRSRLKQFIPAPLDEFIVTEGPGEYRLNLPAKDIFLLSLIEGELLLIPDDAPDPAEACQLPSTP